MIALKPNFDCATVIVKHLCATYLGRCIFAAEVKDNGNLRDTHKSVTFARHRDSICAAHIGGHKRLIIWADCLADFEVKVWTGGLLSQPKAHTVSYGHKVGFYSLISNAKDLKHYLCIE